MECTDMIISIRSPLSREENRGNPNPEERREVFQRVQSTELQLEQETQRVCCQGLKNTSAPFARGDHVALAGTSPSQSHHTHTFCIPTLKKNLRNYQEPKSEISKLIWEFFPPFFFPFLLYNRPWNNTTDLHRVWLCQKLSPIIAKSP